MLTQPAFDTCLQFVNSEARHTPQSRSVVYGEPPRLAITLSRQSGCGAHCVAESLASFLQGRMPSDSPPWAVFDRNLIETVLTEHHLPARLARYMPEDRISELTGALDELLGVHPPVSTLLEQTVETVLRLANRGNVILIGRGAHIITGQLSHAFHVRLVGSLAKRIEHIQEIRGLGKAEALEFIHQEDRGRERYLKKYFGKAVDDDLSYHLVINTDCVSYERAARVIGEAALEHVQTPRRLSPHS
jgi:cytidylate kinase